MPYCDNPVFVPYVPLVNTYRGLTRLSVLALAALLSTACSGSPGPGPGSSPSAGGQPSPGAPSGGSATTSAPATPSSASPTSASPTSSVTSSAAPVAAPRRTAKDLKKALIGVDDLPSGWSVESSSSAGADQPASSSSNPRCAGLNVLLNTNDLAGSQARAETNFSAGADGPFVSQRIDALGSTDAATATVRKISTLAAGCDAVTLRIPGQGSSKMSISQVSSPKVGGKPFALRLAAHGGALDGLEVTFLWAPVGDVVLSLNFINAYPEEFDGITTDAHSKISDVLKVSAQTT